MNRSDRRRWTCALLWLGLLIGVSQTALAHAILTDSTPRLNSTVKGPEVAILLRFNVRIDSSRSRLHLIAPDDSVVTLAMAKPPSPDCLKSTATGLRPGGYTLKWQVLASDGHMSAGEIPFTVN